MNAAALTKALTDVSALLPEVQVAMDAYNGFKAIWLAMNPGKTEDDFRTFLRTSSQENIDDTAALLRAHGWVETTPGNWTHQVTTA